jgi:hypothetical protein
MSKVVHKMVIQERTFDENGTSTRYFTKCGRREKVTRMSFEEMNWWWDNVSCPDCKAKMKNPSPKKEDLK